MYCILNKDISNKMSSNSLFVAFTHSYTTFFYIYIIYFTQSLAPNTSIWEVFSNEHTLAVTTQIQVYMCNKGRLLSPLFSLVFGEIVCKIPTPPYPSGDSSLKIALNMLARTTQSPAINSCRLGCWMLSFD